MSSRRFTKFFGKYYTKGRGRRLNGLPVRRCYSSSGAQANASDIVNFPLSKSVPWLTKPAYAQATNQISETKVTTLDNGLRVATEDKYGKFCTIGVVIDSGSRYEVNDSSGITHFLEKLAFGTTDKYENKDKILQSLEKEGGICDCQGSRDTLIYGMSANSGGVEKAVEILSEVVLRPHITDQELQDTRMATQFELQMLSMQPDPEPILMELIHMAAYKNNTLGLPKLCPAENIQAIGRREIYTFLNHYHTPERMVLAGVGVDHEKVVELAQKYFVGKKPVWADHQDLINGKIEKDNSVSQYTGSTEFIEKDLSNVSLGPTPIPNLAHTVIALESCSHKDTDFVPMCVLNMLMGGGGSFSAGGPGKGMYTRLYTNVLNRHYWMYSATAYNHSYNDGGIFCIQASADPSALRELVEVITKEIVAMQHGISPVELHRAKTQLQSMLLMNLESRPIMFEDIGRQVLANGKRQTAQYYFDQIGKVSEEDIVRVCQRLLRSNPAIAAFGDLQNLPLQKDIFSALHSNNGKLPKKFALFT